MNKPLHESPQFKLIKLKGGPRNGEEHEVTKGFDEIELAIQGWGGGEWCRYKVTDSEGVYLK